MKENNPLGKMGAGCRMTKIIGLTRENKIIGSCKINREATA
jgi:hypothetical protein